MKEVYIKDKVQYIAPLSPLDAIREGLDEAQSLQRVAHDQWSRMMLKISDETFGETIDDVLNELKCQDMFRKEHEELFTWLRDKYLLTLMRKLK